MFSNLYDFGTFSGLITMIITFENDYHEFQLFKVNCSDVRDYLSLFTTIAFMTIPLFKHFAVLLCIMYFNCVFNRINFF